MLELRPMSEAEYRAYRDFAVQDFAAEWVRSGRFNQTEALAEAERQYQTLLPDGLATPDHNLYVLVDGQQDVGMFWTGLRGKEQRYGYIYDIRINDAFQGRGYGTQAIEQLKALALAQGVNVIRLHVFGHNTGAIRLYEKLGFVPTSIEMQLTLENVLY